MVSPHDRTSIPTMTLCHEFGPISRAKAILSTHRRTKRVYAFEASPHAQLGYEHALTPDAADANLTLDRACSGCRPQSEPIGKVGAYYREFEAWGEVFYTAGSTHHRHPSEGTFMYLDLRHAARHGASQQIEARVFAAKRDARYGDVRLGLWEAGHGGGSSLPTRNVMRSFVTGTVGAFVAACLLWVVVLDVLSAAGQLKASS
ncbi:hypothetical protein SCP_0607710 [Sparassis crispa]|uniref:Uncharacterized protein n=1 Tax=Sparassis crispa TaxID=139825 RepID=A0A401GRB5_9APHY|nr:hypothetical protein SCP_0607710 [Sparassis crispa]GBE84791.1 hypothetical protein SCP_0607710 [Sparassis crispa]